MTITDARAAWAQPLSASECELLDFEGTWQGRPAHKLRAIRERFGISAAVYYHRLAVLTERPAALAYRPDVVRRIERIAAAA